MKDRIFLYVESAGSCEVNWLHGGNKARFQSLAETNPHLRVAFLRYGPIALKSFKRRGYAEHPVSLGEHLKKRRMELGLLQKEAANTLHVNGWTYLGWEKDRKKPTARMMSRIIQFLGYDPLPMGESIPQQLLACRRILGLTQRSAAAELAIDEGTFWRYETGEWAPKGERLARIRSLVNKAAARARAAVDRKGSLLRLLAK